MSTERFTPLGWCLTGQHDTTDGRGPCPITLGSAGLCTCSCNDGVRESHGFPEGGS